MSLKNAVLAACGGSAETDPYFKYTTLLLHGDGTNGAANKTFLDSSGQNGGAGWTITPNGNVTQGSFSPYGDRWSNYFSGSDWLTVPDAASNQVGALDFTIEAFVYPTSLPSAGNYKTFWAKRASVTGSGGAVLVIDSAGNLLFFVASSSTVWAILGTSTGHTITLNAWQHLSMVRSGNTLTLYKNGTAGTAVPITFAVYDSGALSLMAGAADGSQKVDGYMSNFRLVKGGAIIPPAGGPVAPLTATVANGTVGLLTCQSNRFIDSTSPNVAKAGGLTITPNGAPKVSNFSPFAPTAAYAPATDGGSGYFDGAGDWLSVGSAANWAFLSNPTAKWTIEGWVYNTTSGTAVTLFDTAAGTTANVGVALNKTSTDFLNVQITYASAGNYIVNGTSTATLRANAWNHIFVAYDQSLASGNLVFYINGTAAGTANKTANTPSSSNPALPLQVGCFGNGAGQFLVGYASSLRISNTVRTPPSGVPTSPYTADANTALLLNFTNAGIYDSTALNDLETVGDAKISTVNPKFGTGSMVFDGTGDLVFTKGPASIFDFGSGDWTVEAWVYPTSTSSRLGILSIDNATSYGTVYLRVNAGTGAQAEFTATSSSSGYDVSIIGGTVPQNTWTFIAATRAGTSFRLFVNGTQVGSTVTSSTVLKSGNDLTVGACRDSSGQANLFNGKVDEVRITKGIARYTANFPLLTAAFPDQ